MLTNPNTLGLFDPAIEEIAHVVHDVGRDALLRRREPQRRDGLARARATWASTSSTSTCTRRSRSRTAAAARAPARSPSRDRIEPFLPSPQVVRRESGNGAGPAFDLDDDRPKSIGRLRGFQGNYGVFVRSYAYILSLGADGLQEASETAVLNANYLMARLARDGRGAPPARVRPHLHARVRAHRRADEEGARDPHARPRQAAARLRLPPADGLLPAAGRRGAADRADRDRDARDARRVRRRDRRDPAPRPPRIRRPR